MAAHLRPALPSDAGAVASIFLAARATMTYLPDLHSAEETRIWIAQVMMVECFVEVAEDDGSVVGFVALEQGHLAHLYVHPDNQGRGVGTELLSWAKGQHRTGFDLWVFQKNERARAFYRREGLVEIRRTDGTGNEEREPDVLYGWPGERSTPC